jgi:NAD-dependent dihydropyrimidine dehydrogenase PreA subunit
MKGEQMVTIETKICTGCGGCVNLCPVYALSLGKDDKASVNDKCNDCGICIKACPVNCIK